MYFDKILMNTPLFRSPFRFALHTALCLFMVCFPTAIFGQSPRPCIILGSQTTVNDPRWKDKRIGFGISNLIAEIIYDSKQFSLFDEKESVRESLAQVRALMWNGDAHCIDFAIAKLQSDSIVTIIGRVISCNAPKSRASLGPFSAGTDKIIITSDVEIIVSNRLTYVGRGTGSATKTATGSFLSLSENAILFDQTTLGSALQQSISSATKSALSQYLQKAKNAR